MKSFILLLIQGLTSNLSRGELTTVHLICHSHTDIGWQNTIEGYFYRDKRGGGSSFT